VIYFIFGLIFLIQLLLVLFAYGKMQYFQNYIDKKFINYLSIFCVVKKNKNKDIIYNLAINTLVASVVLSLSYLDEHSILSTLILFISLCFYLFSIAQIINININTFENKYLDEFIIALNIGLFFNFINELILAYDNCKDFDFWSIIFLVCFIILLGFKLKHNKALEEK